MTRRTEIASAMVLAAGLGTRMRPLTDTRPKPLVQFAGRTMIDHVLDRIADAAIPRAVVNVHHHADLIERHLAGRTQPTIVISDERDALLDTGGGVARALPLLGSGAFLIHNSDSQWIEGHGRNLDRLAEAWDPAAMDSLMLLAPTHGSLGYDGRGDFDMAADGRLSRRIPETTAPFAFTGVSIASPQMLEGAPQGCFSLNMLWDRAAAQGRLFGVRLDGTWMHIGTPQALAEAEALVARG